MIVMIPEVIVAQAASEIIENNNSEVHLIILLYVTMETPLKLLLS